MLDFDGDGVLTPDEKRESTIIIYGHSWGAAETVTFAHAPKQMGILVALTIQIDAIAKPGRRWAITPGTLLQRLPDKVDPSPVEKIFRKSSWQIRNRRQSLGIS
jgi:hypothetical protein